MIITRFKGEMLFSHDIRRGRLRACSPELSLAPSSHKKSKPCTVLLRSLRLPYLSRYEGERLASIETFTDATAWPLVTLLMDLPTEAILKCTGRGWPTFCHGAFAQPESCLRFCEMCMQEQREQYAVSWWMRDLNLPLVSVCPHHQIRLHSADRDAVMAVDGLLPHELRHIALPIRGEIDNRSIEIAKFVVKLCVENSQATRAWLKALAPKILWNYCSEYAEKFRKNVTAQSTPNNCYMDPGESQEYGLLSDRKWNNYLIIVALGRTQADAKFR